MNTRKMLTPAVTSAMLRALQTSPRSLLDLVAISNLAKPTVTRYVNELHAGKIVHVAGWLPDRRGYPTIRQFLCSDSVDAGDMPCPVAKRRKVADAV